MTITTGTTPASAQASWKRVSNWAKARPRLACGASCWTIDSKPMRPMAAARFSAPASSTPAGGPPSTAATPPATTPIERASVSMRSSVVRARSRGARMLPSIEPSADTATASANQNVPADTLRNQKARWKKRKPTLARRSVIASARGADARGVELRALGRRLGRRRDHVGREAPGAEEADREHRRRVDQGGPAGQRVDQLQRGGREHGHEAGQAGDHAELGVGLDEVGLGAHDRRHDGRLRDQVRLLQDERGEDQREQGEAVDRQRHPQRDHDPAQGDELDDEAAPTGGAVDRRPDQRPEHDERGEADDEEEQHPAPGRARVDAQEQRVGEGDEHRRVAAHHRGVGDGEAPEPRHPHRGRHHGDRTDRGRRRRRSIAPGSGRDSYLAGIVTRKRDDPRPETDAAQMVGARAGATCVRTCSRGRGW